MNVIFAIKEGDKRHEAIPVRAIPFVTGWTISPDAVASSLSQTSFVAELTGLVAYHLNGNDEPAPMLPKDWDCIEAELRILSDALKANEIIDFDSYPTWRRESIPLLPAGVFVWKDEFISAFSMAYSEERMGILDERPGDRKLNLTPFIPEALREIVMEGFSARLDAPPIAEKTLGTTERKTLLTIIAALAKEAKINIDPPGKAAGFIAGLTQALGAGVSKRAIEEHLKKIPDALEARMK